MAPATVVFAGAPTCQPAFDAAGAWLPASTAAIEPPDAAQFSDSAVFGPLANSVHPPVAADWPLQVTTVYSAAPAGAAPTRTAKRKRKRSWTLMRTVARTRGAASSFSPAPAR